MFMEILVAMPLWATSRFLVGISTQRETMALALDLAGQVAMEILRAVRLFIT
jgi:hypothetical protein